MFDVHASFHWALLSCVSCERLWTTSIIVINVVKKISQGKKKKSLYLSRDSRADRHEIPKRDSIVNNVALHRLERVSGHDPP